MSEHSLKKIEKFLWGIFALLGLILVIGLILLFQNGKSSVERENKEEKEVQPTDAEPQEPEWKEGLSDSTSWLPQGCELYEILPDITFQNGEGNKMSLQDFLGTPIVLVFWASWCDDCKEQMPHMREYMELAEEYGEIQFLFLNRLDGSRETRESADAYFQELGLPVSCYYDENENVYQSLGIRNIPTTLFVDDAGRVISWCPRQITEKEVFRAYLKNLCQGNRKAVADFVLQELMDEAGGIHSEYVPGDENATRSSSVLSESQGALLEYAVLVKDRDVFERGFSYIQRYMREDGQGLPAWCVSNGEASDVNALIDDLRVYGALQQAQKLWGGYEEELQSLRDALKKQGISRGNYVDFYDTKSRQPAGTLTLCYVDLMTMDALGEEEKELRAAAESARDILLQGQISEEFPLYHCRYDYKKQTYTGEELNMAEAMVTLLHLAEAGCLPENTIAWLKQEMAQGGIMARYNVEGQVVDGYRYESTATYALLALTAQVQGEEELREQALRKMEKMRIIDCSKAYNGAFGMADGTGITSFDQLMPLLTYTVIENDLILKE